MITRSAMIVLLLAGCGEVAGTASTKGDLPTITTVAPAIGGAPGGTQITLVGTNFANGTTQVVVGDRLSAAVTVESPTSLSFTLPPGAEGATVDVSVFNDGGFGTLPDSFTYNFRPAVLAISPSLGKGNGGTAITIAGRGFADAGTPTITIAGGVATNVVVVDDQTITATTAAVEPSTALFTALDVDIENNNGLGRLGDAFSVTRPGLLAVSKNNQLLHIDLINKKTAVLQTFPRLLRACVLNPNNGKIYVAGRNPMDRTQELMTVDPLTGVITTIGPTREAGNGPIRCPSSLAFVGSVLYGVNTGLNCGGAPANRLVTIDPATATTTVVGAAPLALDRPNAIAIKDAVSLYFADRITDSLDTIATATSVLTTGQPLTGAPTGQSVTAMASVGGVLYLTDRLDPASLYTANPATGALTKVMTIPDQSIAGLCETPPTF